MCPFEVFKLFYFYLYVSRNQSEKTRDNTNNLPPLMKLLQVFVNL